MKYDSSIVGDDEIAKEYQKTLDVLNSSIAKKIKQVFARQDEFIADPHCKSATQQIDIYFTHIGMLHAV